MTPQERTQILALSRCRVGHRAFDKRFIRDLSSQVRRRVARNLSRSQRYTLAKMVHRYRRQLEKRLPAELQINEAPQASDYGLVDKAPTVDDLFTGEPSPPLEAYANE